MKILLTEDDGTLLSETNVTAKKLKRAQTDPVYAKALLERLQTGK